MRWGVLLASVVGAVALAPGAGAAASTPAPISGDPFGPEAPGSHATEVEPSAVAFGSQIVAAFQVGRIFTGGAAAIGFATSADAGATWRSGLVPGLTPSSPEPGGASFASDPVVAYDAAHRTWLIAALSRELGVTISASPDGTTWGPPVQARTVAGELDKEWLTCDNWPGSPFLGRCYMVVSAFERAERNVRLAVQSSSDGGATWSAQVEIPIDYDGANATLSAAPVVRPDGELVIVFFERDEVRAIRSRDGGGSFLPRETVSTHTQRRYTFARERFRGTAVPTAGVNAGGTVFGAWYDCRFRPRCTGNDVVLTRSDGAGSWSAPARIPLGPQDATDYVIPNLGVDVAARGRIALAYYALSSHDCSGDGCSVQAGLAGSTDGGETWRAEPVGDAMPLGWLAPTTLGRMLADYVAAVFVPGRAIGIFALAGAPAAGRFTQAIYASAVPSATRLTAIRLAASPRSPVAGRPFAVRVSAVQPDGGGWVIPETTACRASVGTSALRPAGGCRWLVPRSAKGRLLTVAVTATYGGATVRTVERRQVLPPRNEGPPQPAAPRVGRLSPGG